ncbi:Phage tail fibre repeat-containing protein [Kosakonia arachidis]|uniref:Phage tail fibre repeat-containing protein n=1 Tax=Kosakonia arachidis TaxID=551989 RepID=A0A1I7E346_9ENTR|nr:tail fiber protein [Kosakonia arachidis]SFU18381.1 Phage tail fibre repeat-containing protein [Kosakonia arachidis]
MATKYKTVVTTAGVAKFAAALTPGGKKVNITAMAVGDGGGTLPQPDAGQTKLINEVWRQTLNKISQDNRHKNYVVAELVIPPETGGFWLREMGLYDDTGTLVAVGNMAESYKPELEEGSGRAQTLRMVIMLSDVASVELAIDGSVVMATQDYVDDKLAEHEQSRRHPDATLTDKGFTQLSSATDSAAENLAATPRAVKAAYDLASGKYTAQDATTAQKGLVQLSSATDNVSEALAATPKAVKAAYDLANGKYTAQDATTGQKGLVQLSSATDNVSEALAATPKAVKAAYDLANGKYTAQDATTGQKGLVQLSSATDNASEVLAATPRAVKAANDNANGRVPLTRRVNGRELSADINVTAQDIFNGQAVAIGNAADLNSFMTPGLYYQNTNDYAAAGANYPEASAGSLEVYKHAGITQIYRIYNNSRSYIRTYWNNVWSAWVSSIDASGGTINGELNLHRGFWISDKQTGITFGNDDASFNSANMMIKSWYGIGFYSTLNGNEGMAGYINVRTGHLQMAGHIVPGNYSNFDERYLQDLSPYATTAWVGGNFAGASWVGTNFLQGGIRLASPGEVNNGNNDNNFAYAPAGAVVTAVLQKSNYTAVQYRYIQYNIGGNWFTAWVA